MSVNQELQKEHRAVELSLRLLDRIMEKMLKDPAPTDIDHIEELLEFFNVFVDQCHHGKEETYLFPALEKNGIKKQDGPIGVLLGEHERGRQYTGQMKSLIPELRKADTRAFSDMNKIAKSHIALMQQHIQKEDEILFPMIDSHLTGKMQAELLEDFDRLEQEKIGPGRHEQFHDMLNRLDRLY